LEASIDQALRELEASPFKMTPQRQTILQVLARNRDRHLSAEDLHLLLQQQGAEIGIATVYRTLDLLTELNIIHKVDFGDGCKRFEFTPQHRHRHHHLICLQCGDVTEVKEDFLNQLEEAIEAEHNFRILDHSVKFLGHCVKCRAD
jgi:Fur family ferric uptake transcriptional regulator